MQKYLVLYKAPTTVIEAWMQTPEEERKAAETKMQAEWQAWLEKHKDVLDDQTAGLGKTKRVTAEGVTDVKNDLMMCSILSAESLEAAAKLCEGHPHFGVPEASIEIMPLNYLPGMGQ